jgi:hypothetical protein
MHIKLPMYLFYMGLGLNEFAAGKSITWAIGRGGALKIETFLSPNGTRFARCQIRVKRGSIFGPPPPWYL